MAAKTETQFNSFVAGIITEASPLTFPPNASLDEDNFLLERNGSRSRRAGVDFEAGYQLNPTGISSTALQGGKQSAHIWSFPGGNSSVTLCVVRIADKLWFMDLLAGNPSGNLKNGGNSITIAGLQNSNIETSLITNNLVLVSKDLNKPILLTYNSTTDIVSQQNIDILIRDLYGVDDGLQTTERPQISPNTHTYNLRNQGWSERIVTAAGTEVLAGYAIVDSIPFPSNADQWFLGKGSDPADTSTFEKFSANILTRNSVNSSQVARGSYILDAFNRGSSRADQTLISGLPLDQEQGRISTVASYASRVFYSGVNGNLIGGDDFSPNYSGAVFFSQVITSNDKLGKCFQEADPTSEDISDLVDTDGGVILIPEASRIVKIINAKASLLVFASNGVWEIYGDTGGFIATSYQLSKVSSNGISNPKAIIEVNGSIIYWSKAGIYTLSQEPTTGRYNAENISLTTIQTLYTNINDVAKNNAKGFYDEKENTVRWLYNDLPDYTESNYVNKYNSELIFDLTLKAFYTNTISSMPVNSPYICDYVEIPSFAVNIVNNDVYVDTELVQTTSLDTVIISENVATGRNSQFSFLTIQDTSFTLSKYNNLSFMDWFSVGGVDFKSYLITGYDITGDIMRNKQIPYIWMYFTQTEDGYMLDNSGNLNLAHQSSCLVQAQWGWANSVNSGKWGNVFQAYRMMRNYIPTGITDTFDTGEKVVVTKNKLRGTGKAISLFIQSESGKDMKFLGWAYSITADNVP